MKVLQATSSLTGIPDYFAIYNKWLKHYETTGDNRSQTLAFHYARVAEEMGQALIEEDTTMDDIVLEVVNENR